MDRHWYRYAGIGIVSDLALDDLADFAITDRPREPVRFRLRAGEVEGEAGWSFASDAHWTLIVPGVARYDVTDGSGIAIVPHVRAGAGEVRLFLMASAWAALCYQRGLVPFHASVLEVAGRGIAFCGPSGSGKSSTAAWLVEHGHRLVSDDLTMVHDDGIGPVGLWPSIPRLRLWPAAVNAVSYGWGGGGG